MTACIVLRGMGCVRACPVGVRPGPSMFDRAKKTSGHDLPGVMSARLDSRRIARDVTFVWSLFELGITARFAKNWPQTGIILFSELLSQRTRYRRADFSHRLATAAQVCRVSRPRMSIFPHMPDSKPSGDLTGFTVRPQTSVTSWTCGMVFSRRLGQRHGGKEMPERVNMQGLRRAALWERHEFWSSGSSVYRDELPDALGMRAARPVESTYAPSGEVRHGAPGVGHRRCAQARRRECRRGGSVIRQHRQPERRRGIDRGTPAAAGRPGRGGITRKAGTTSNGGRPSTRQDMAISKGRMHFEPFTVSGCPDQEIRNADL